MMTRENKKRYKHALKKSLGLKTVQTRQLGYICGTIEISEDFIEGLSHCDADFVIFSQDQNFPQKSNIVFTPFERVEKMSGGFDFFVCSSSSEKSEHFIKQQIVPIVQERHYLNSLLEEFHPVRGQGNCFVYKEADKWSITAAISRYIVNSKFSHDSKTLLKNLQSF